MSKYTENNSEFNFRDIYRDWFKGRELTTDQIDYMFEYVDRLQSALRDISDGGLTRKESTALANEVLSGD